MPQRRRQTQPRPVQKKLQPPSIAAEAPSSTSNTATKPAEKSFPTVAESLNVVAIAASPTKSVTPQ